MGKEDEGEPQWRKKALDDQFSTKTKKMITSRDSNSNLLVSLPLGRLLHQQNRRNQPALLKKLLALDPKLENIGIGQGMVKGNRSGSLVLSPRAGVDSLIADILVFYMDETDLSNALHHHYTRDRAAGTFFIRKLLWVFSRFTSTLSYG